MQFFIFIFPSKSSSVSLQSHPEDTLCTNFQTKWRIQFLTQICPKNGFRFGILKNKAQNKNQDPRDLGLKFEKTNVEIRISILGILGAHMCVCQFSSKTNSFDFFSPNLPKNELRVRN